MRRLVTVLLGCLAVAGCSLSQAPTPQAGGQSYPHELSAGDQAACTAAGGRMERRGRLGAELCVKPFADAGKACTDTAQCQGKCVAIGNADATPKAGQCQSDDRLFGCYAEIKGGKAAYTICVD